MGRWFPTGIHRPKKGEAGVPAAMKPENRLLVNAVVAVLVVTGFVGGYLLLAPGAIATALPIPAGTTFTSNDTMHWVVHFTVGAGGGRLVGAWTAYNGAGYIGLVVANGTVSKPPQLAVICPVPVAWEQSNGSVDRALAPGNYTIYWSTGFCSFAARIVVTRAIEVVGP